MKLIDLTGKTFGRLTVIGRSGSASGHPTWDCVCSCGKRQSLALSNVKNAGTDCPHGPRFDDITGQRFGRLTVTGFAGHNRHRQTRWSALCECGGETVVTRLALTTRCTQSCGCLKADTTRARSTKHGRAPRENREPEYAVWLTMKARCMRRTAAGFASYGARGISVCERWLSYENFISDMGKRPSDAHTLERRDNDLGYGPDNCEWATRAVQANNKRSSRHIEHNGKTLTYSEWSCLSGVPQATIRWRHLHGWSAQDAIFKPTTKDVGASA